VAGVARLRAYAGAVDDQGIALVRKAVRAREGDVWLPGPEDDPAGARLRCLIAEQDGRIVGYTWTESWTEVDGTRLYLLLGWVDPGYRRRGIGAALLARQEAAAAGQDATAAGPEPLAGARGMYGANADESQVDTREMLLRRGYAVAFTLVHMRCELPAPGSAEATVALALAPLPGRLRLRRVEHDQHPRVHAAIEECFQDSRYGHVARGYEEYLADVQRRQTNTDLWCVAWDGEQIAGVAVNEVEPDGGGLTAWVAVRSPWRRMGLATALMRESHRRLAAVGVSGTRLTTIAENPNDSIGLYRRLGYAVTRGQPRYRKPIGQ
jgi:mycothiol synthase